MHRHAWRTLAYGGGVRTHRILPLTACLALAACGTGGTTSASSTSTVTVTASSTAGPQTTPAEASAPATSTAAATSVAESPTSDGAATSSAQTSTAASATASVGRCSALVQSLTPEQRVGQLLMVGLDSSWPATHNDATIAKHKVGNVIYLGGWYGSSRVLRTSQHLQSLATQETTGGVKMLVAADQEGGTVHQLRGEGFTAPPSALAQTRLGAAAITDLAADIGGQLTRAGVNMNLAPVADTVPDSLGRANEPIGKWGRQYSSDPAVGSRAVSAFVRGLEQAGVASSVKHFPGLGRVTKNTDFNAEGITDAQTTGDDAYLQPFTAGIEAGTSSVMVSSARYPAIDASGTQAVFSKPVVTGLLRDKLGYRGVVVTDDMGNAKAVAATPPGQRAVRFLEAGGDLVLTGQPTDIAPMAGALLEKRSASPEFAQRVDESVARVLELKARYGLASCG